VAGEAGHWRSCGRSYLREARRVNLRLRARSLPLGHTLADVKDALNCHIVVLHLNDLRNSRVLLEKNVGIEPHWLVQIAKYVPEVHAPLPPQPIVDEPHALSRHVADAIIDNSTFVQEWLKPQGLIDIMQLFLMHTPARFSGLGLAWHERHGVVTDPEFKLARLLLPHVRRAVTISNVLDISTIESMRMTQTNARCATVRHASYR